MLRSDEHWLELVDKFADTAVCGGSWYDPLEGLAHATGSEFGQLIGLGARPAVPFNIWTIDPVVPSEFDQLGYHDPALNPRVRAGIGVSELTVRAEVDFITPAEAREHPHYKWARHHGIGYICLTPLIVRPDMLIGLSVCRSEETGHITTRQRRIFASLAAHLRAAIRMQLLLEEDASALLIGAMEAMSLTAFACNSKGEVVAMTPKAEQLVTGGRYFKLKAGQLSTELSNEAAQFNGIIKVAAVGLVRPGQPLLRSFFLHSAAEPLKSLVVDVIPLPKRSFSFGFRPRVLVIARGLEQSDHQLVVALSMCFGITAAEAQVAILLANGDDAQSIAQKRGVSINTVRSQVRSIYDKLGVSRQSELAARLRPLR